MRFLPLAPALLLLLSLTNNTHAQATYSTSAAPDAPSSDSASDPAPSHKNSERKLRLPSNRPFSALAISAKLGTGGIGADLATPLSRYFNLRVGAQAFDHPLTFRTTGIYSAGDLTLQNLYASVDYFPRHGAFHLSPGVTIHNDTHLTTTLHVPPGARFFLGDQGSYSDPNDPISGIARLKMGNVFAPRFTLGWGNMLPRKGHRFSFPFEAGFQYTSSPTLSLQLYGSACDDQGNCGFISSGTGPKDLQDEVQLLNKDLEILRFYPILSMGFSYSFGH